MCTCGYSTCIDWDEAAQKAAARALDGGRWGSSSAASQMQGGSGTTPRFASKVGGGAAGIQDPFLLSGSGKVPWGAGSVSGSNEPAPTQQVALGARLCDALLFAESASESQKAAARDRVRKASSPVRDPSVYGLL